MTTPPQDAAATARELTGALNRMSERLEQVKADSEARDAALTTFGRANRRRINWTVVSVVVDVALTIALGLVGLQAHANSVAVRKASASNLALCQAGNVSRQQQIELWDFVLSLPSSHKQTAQQKQNVATFRHHLAIIFAPRDCAELARKGRL